MSLRAAAVRQAAEGVLLSALMVFPGLVSCHAFNKSMTWGVLIDLLNHDSESVMSQKVTVAVR